MVTLLEQGLYNIRAFCGEIYAAIPNSLLIPEIFLKVANLSLTACVLVLAVLILRLVFRKAPRWIFCLLWGLVAVRLICPISIETNFSLIPKVVGNGTLVSEWADYYVGDTWIIEDSSIYYDAAVFNGREPILAEDGSYYVVAAYDQLGEPATVENTVVPILGWIWVVGMVVMLVYSWGSYLSLKRSVATAVPLRGNIKRSEQVEVPFVLGLFHPVIYVPYKIADSDLEYVIAHEEAHIRRKDHWWKPIGFVILSVYWFNPLLWVAYVLLCKDIELACDEKVIRTLGMEQRQDYSLALLNCSVKRYRIAACPLAFGEVSVKERVQSVMNYKKPAFWIVVAGVIACAVAAVCFLTNPKENLLHAPEPFGATYRVIDDIYYDPLISSRYIVGETTPYYSFSEDYAMFESETDARNWYQTMGTFEKIKLKKDNFDAYFNMMGQADTVWMEDLAKELRQENDKAWRFDIAKDADDLSNTDSFYYLMLQDNGDIYLALGNREVEEHFYEGSVEKVWFHCIFKLEELDYVWVDIWTKENLNIMTMVPGWYPEGEFDAAKDLLTTVSVNDSCVIEMQLDHVSDVLKVEEHYYERTEQGTNIQKKTYELTPDENDTFKLEVERRNDVRDEQAIYFVETENGQGVFKILFPIEESEEGVVEDTTQAQTGQSEDLQPGTEQYGVANSEILTLDEAMSAAILKFNADYYPTGNFACENHIILKREQTSLKREQTSGTPVEGVENVFNEVTVYAMAYYQVFGSYGGKLTKEGSSHWPVIMTFDIEENGNHKLTDYWKPSSGGAEYVKEVKEAFPDEIEANALDTQKYIKEQQEACEQKAMDYVKEYGSVDQQIAALLGKMCSTQLSTSSAATDYIEWFGDDYGHLLAYDIYTLRYCFEQFLEGGQTDLRGHIMAQACQDILAIKGEALLMDYEVANGQEWFDVFKANVETLNIQYSDEMFGKFYPGSWMLKQMLKEKTE